MAHSALVIEQPPPMTGRLADWYPDADLLDSFAVELPARSGGDIRAIAQAILGQTPPWPVKTVASIQQRVGRLTAPRTTDDVYSADDAHGRINALPILSSTDHELIVGKDGRRMSFRVALMIEKSSDGRDLVSMTTAVRCHDRLGHIYLAAIKPFHRMVAPSTLRRAARRGFA